MAAPIFQIPGSAKDPVWQECSWVRSERRFRFLHGSSTMAVGSYGDVYKCKAQWLDSEGRAHENLFVAVKRLRLIKIDQSVQTENPQEVVERMQNRLRREVELLENLNHPNILFLLAYNSPNNPFEQVMVTDWYEGGNLQQWMKKHKLSTREKYSLIRGIADGIEYLHDQSPQPVVHGDLRPDNILVKRDGTPVIIDFGLSSRTGDEDEMKTYDSRAASNRGGSHRWQPPGRVNDEHVRLTDDIYALGCLILVILTDKQPYHMARGEGDVWRLRAQGESPSSPLALAAAEQPPSLSPDSPWWRVMNQCWSKTFAEGPGVPRYLQKSPKPGGGTVHMSVIHRMITDTILDDAPKPRDRYESEWVLTEASEASHTNEPGTSSSRPSLYDIRDPPYTHYSVPSLHRITTGPSERPNHQTRPPSVEPSPKNQDRPSKGFRGFWAMFDIFKMKPSKKK